MMKDTTVNTAANPAIATIPPITPVQLHWLNIANAAERVTIAGASRFI